MKCTFASPQKSVFEASDLNGGEISCTAYWPKEIVSETVLTSEWEVCLMQEPWLPFCCGNM